MAEDNKAKTGEAAAASANMSEVQDEQTEVRKTMCALGYLELLGEREGKYGVRIDYHSSAENHTVAR